MSPHLYQYTLTMHLPDGGTERITLTAGSWQEMTEKAFRAGFRCHMRHPEFEPREAQN